MFKFITLQFDIDVVSEILIDKNITKIKSNKGTYIVKKVDNDALESIYLRLFLLHNNVFNLPLRGKNDLFIQNEDDNYYVLFKYYEDISLVGLDLKLSFFIKNIASLHQATYVELNANDNYLDSTLNYLDQEVKNISDAIESRMEVIEHNDYHSPNDWYFMMHYHDFKLCLEEASRHILDFENQIKDKKSLRVCLTYQNFDFNHILLKHEKIISLEKMNFNFASYDLYNMISNLKINSLNINNYLVQYLKINPLLDYEKHYLVAILYIFTYHRYKENIDDLNHLIEINKYLSIIRNIQDEVIFSSQLEE